MPSARLSDAPVVEVVQFRSEPWLLRGKLTYTDEVAPVASAVIAGPHPLLGGTLENNVVRALGEGLPRLGIVTLRFDYRGVGVSDGPAADVASRLTEFWQSSRLEDEANYADDLAAAVRFVCSAFAENLPVAMVGYSFGCSLLATVPGVHAATPLALVAPTVGTRAYESFASTNAPKLVIAPEGDFAAEAGKLRRWYEQLMAPKELVRPRLDGHFFRGHESWLVDTVGRFISDNREAPS